MTSSHPYRPLILVSNDDGIASHGLWALVRAVQPLGDLWVAAPLQQQSGAGRSRIVFSDVVQHQRVSINGVEVQQYALDMTPAQAVYHGISVLAPRRPSLVIAGINYGENLGNGILGSGTVGAALEGAAWSIPSLAVSLETGPEYHLSNSPEIDFDVAAYVSAEIARRVLASGLPAGVDLLKIDLPKGVTKRTPWRFTRQSRRRLLFLRRDTGAGFESIIRHGRQRDPAAVPIDPGTYERSLDPTDAEIDSDIRVVLVDREVSICPLSTDLSAPIGPEEMAGLLRH